MGAERAKRAPPRIQARVVKPLLPARPLGPQGSLFEHFGVEARADVRAPAAIVKGQACPRCTWLVTERDGERCPMCGGEL